MKAPLLLAAALETALNRYLRLAPETLAGLAELTGKVVAVTIDGPGLTFYLFPGQGGIQVLDTFAGRPDVHLRGTPAALVAMARGSGGAGQVEIHGDAHLAQRLKTLLAGIEIDWEEQLSHWVGDLAAHQIARAVQGARARAEDSLRRLGRQLGDYLQHEQQTLPTASEVRAFVDEVDAVRNDVERLAARIERLAARRRMVR